MNFTVITEHHCAVYYFVKMLPTLSFILMLLGIIRSETMPNWITLKNHPAWNTLKKFECGEQFADRIIGGTNAELGQFPWIARLGYDTDYDKELEWLCGGTLITDRHVVTAAHCLGNDSTTVYRLKMVRMGELDITKNPDCTSKLCAPPVQDIAVKKYEINSQFNNPLLHNDIAMVELAAPVKLNDFVMPACLPEGDQFGRVKLNDKVVVAGWGKTNVTTEEKTDILKFVQLPIVDNRVCESVEFKNFKLTKGEICAGAQMNKDACGGDSGGPLMQVYDTDSGPKTFLMGIVSFGPTMCGIKKPGVYTDVSYHLGWILDHIV